MKTLIAKKDFTEHGIFHRKGDLIDYYPWDYEWQGMTEPQRVARGIFVNCEGMGDFEVFREDQVGVTGCLEGDGGS